ncbi:phage major capsid protein [Sinorhizobium meliloti]|uniref:phage major capsid protein n=1 Tax=Rhizobium meliloti TaxID=382 RepID=UPI000FD988AC|nr:phage major capsid protein [Sinorhizobium meliloti]RVL75346.1 phage major capsid protein [Sinorhizobium meliloti]
MADIAADIAAVKSLSIAIERRLRRGAINPLRETQKALVRSVIVKLVADSKPGVDPDVLAKHLFGNGAPSMRSLSGLMRVKAAVSPAMTSVPSWAGDLVGDEVYMAGLAILAPQSAYGQLTAAGLRVELPSTGAPIRIPSARVDEVPVDPFIAEGGAIPARARFLENHPLASFKAALLSVVTGDLLKRGPATMENIVTRLLSQDIMRGVDKVLLGTGAATTSRPAGILNGATVVPPSTSTDPAIAAAADITALITALADPMAAERPILIMNQAQAIALDLMYPTAGVPVIVSEFIAAGTVAAVDAADFASGAAPDSFDVNISTEAIVHNDTAPTADVMTGNPVMSLWQQDCRGVRLIEDINWTLLTPAATITGVTW